MKRRWMAAGVSVAAIAAMMSINAFAAVGVKSAEETALAHAGLARDEVKYLISQEDYDGGRRVYEVEFLTADGQEYDYEIAVDGSILSYDYDAEKEWDDIAENRNKIRQAEAGISESEARKIALEKAELKETELVWEKIKLDHEDGKLVYEGELYSRTSEYEFEIDAESGKVLKWESEWRD